jgi:hypothetical protein
VHNGSGTIFFPEKGNGAWKQKDVAEVGKGQECKRPRWTATVCKERQWQRSGWRREHPQNVFLFVQDAAPCSGCHDFFLKEAKDGRAFIFVITGKSYAILKGVTVQEFFKSDHDENTLKPVNTYKLTGPAELEEKELPVALYFHRESAFLAFKPQEFPLCPSIIAHLGKP